ncbi:hypothetical protein PFISCL1PPCAC_18072, partial [Pristionchus fissidentatus]
MEEPAGGSDPTMNDRICSRISGGGSSHPELGREWKRFGSSHLCECTYSSISLILLEESSSYRGWVET